MESPTAFGPPEVEMKGESEELLTDNREQAAEKTTS
jgi:hypothetical protein